MMKMLLTDIAISEEEVSGIVNAFKNLSWGAVVKVILLALVLIIVVKLLNKLLGNIIEKSKLEKSLHGFLKATIKIVLYFVAVMILAGSLNIDVTSLIALFSVAGLALSLAIQGSLSNLAGGIVILVTKPLRVGDYVAIGGEEGTVEVINMTYTTLVTVDHRKIFIPNSTVTSSNVVNYTVGGRRRVDFVVTASYECPAAQVKAALIQAIEAVPQLAETEEKFARVTGYKDCGVEYTIRAWCKTADYWDAYYGLVEAVKDSFDENQVTMSYPNINVYMAND